MASGADDGEAPSALFETAPSNGSFPNEGWFTTTEIGIGPVAADETEEYADTWAQAALQEVATRIDSTLDRANFGGGGFVLNKVSNYNANLYDRDAEVGTWGPIYPVNESGNHFLAPGRRLHVAYYENPFLLDPLKHPNVAWPYETAAFDQVVYPVNGPHKDKRIYLASRVGSEGVDKNGHPQQVCDLAAYSDLQIYHQDQKDTVAGYNPNEEHALVAPSNRAGLKMKTLGTDIPNNPPLAAFALQEDLNATLNASNSYGSDPWVLVQVNNLANGEPEMAAYRVKKQRAGNVAFPRPDEQDLQENPGLAYEDAPLPENRFVTIDPDHSYDFAYTFSFPVLAGDLLILPYPLNLVIGNVIMADSDGGNDNDQRVLWHDDYHHTWVISGGGTFFYKYFYPFRGDFHYPGLEAGTPVPFLPDTDTENGTTHTFAGAPANLKPGKVVYTASWRSDYPRLKRGETLTYQGGEYFNETPGAKGLPALVAMKAAEIVYDDATPTLFSCKGPEESATPATTQSEGELFRVGSVIVYEHDLAHRLRDRYDSRADEATRQAALDDLVRSAQFAQAALDAGMADDPIVRDQISRSLESSLRETSRRLLKNSATPRRLEI